MCIQPYDEFICINCCQKMLGLLDNLQIEITEFKQPTIFTMSNSGIEEQTCDLCDETIEEGDYCFTSQEDYEDFLEEALEKAAEVLSSKIEFCSHCGGQDIEHYLHMWNDELDEDEELQSEGIDVYDFLAGAEVPEEYWNKIIHELRCSNCNYGEAYHPKHNPDGGSFELTDRIYSKEEIDSFWGYDEFIEFAAKYGYVFTQAELDDFLEKIYHNPLFASKHQVGEQIYSLLNEHYQKNDYCELPQGKLVYRGRIRKVSEPTFQASQLWSPPYGMASHGRYNPIGVSILYCCDTPSGVESELHPTSGEAIEIGLLLVKKRLRLFDIDNMLEGFEGFFRIPNLEQSPAWKKAYLFTNYIGSCCKEIGFDGVQYKGVSKLNYTNFALFNVEPDKDMTYVEVKSKTY